LSELPDFSVITRDIVTDDDAELAMHVLSWISAREAADQADLRAVTVRKRQELVDKCRIEFEGVSFSFSEVRKTLTGELEKFGAAQRARLFAKKQSVQFTHGVIRTRKATASVDLAPGETVESVLKRMGDLPHYQRTSVAIDLQAIRADRLKGLLTDETLKEWGLVFDDGEATQNITIDPK